MSALAALRAEYADRLLARAGVDDPRLHAAFATVPREAFLGPGPWLIADFGHYRRTETDDAREVYTDALFALDPIHSVNNGEPSAHALWIAALELKEGERVNHIGAGTGYYSAILAEMVSGHGSIEAFEIDPALADKARATLADRPNVRVHAVSGAEGILPRADAIYVNAGASAPLPVWLDALTPGGRLVFPLTGGSGGGGMLRITRGSSGRWPARVISGAGFINLVGGRTPGEGRAVEDAFRRGGASDVRWLESDHVKGDRDWLRGDGWRLTK
jgi:protein-L-isoaspartate(D-aspartate) O-methyltransferase